MEERDTNMMLFSNLPHGQGNTAGHTYPQQGYPPQGHPPMSGSCPTAYPPQAGSDAYPPRPGAYAYPPQGGHAYPPHQGAYAYAYAHAHANLTPPAAAYPYPPQHGQLEYYPQPGGYPGSAAAMEQGYGMSISNGEGRPRVRKRILVAAGTVGAAATAAVIGAAHALRSHGKFKHGHHHGKFKYAHAKISGNSKWK
ncbi:hypothetical protein ACP4OV_015859 [Aristida adscensionis]